MTVFVILDRHNRIRGYPYPDLALAEDHAREADATWPDATPHRIVPFVPERAVVVEAPR